MKESGTIKSYLLVSLWRIMSKAFLLQAIVLLAIFGLGYWQKWEKPSYGGAFFFAGLFALIVAGFSVGGTRQQMWSNMTFVSLNRITSESERDSGAKGRFLGLAGFLWTYSTPLFFALVGLVTIIIGIILQSLYPA